MNTFLECRNCNGTNVKFHEYRTFSYYYCSDCKSEVSANIHPVEGSLRPRGAHPALAAPYVGIDFSQNMQDALDELNKSFAIPSSGPSGPPQPAPVLPVGSHNGNSGVSLQSQPSTETLDDQHSCRSSQAQTSGKFEESNLHACADAYIQETDDHLEQPVCIPEDRFPELKRLQELTQQLEDLLFGPRR